MTSEAMRNGNKHFENLLFSKMGTPRNRAGVRTPPRSAPAVKQPTAREPFPIAWQSPGLELVTQ